ncbi:MAG TPA: GatB/YqeY domain-containing protein [Bacteroidota bacterium]|nr:GatB/YqeY domain-containing protein [Bacteroidota bacterium]
MTLTQKISEDLKNAMKAGDKNRIDTLRMVRAQILEFEKKGLNRDMTADEEMALLLSAVKKRRESIEIYEKAGRTELAEKETAEVAIISEYLPKQMSREEAQTIIAGIVAQAGASGPGDLGKVMPLVMKELKGKLDGRVINEIVRSALS